MRHKETRLKFALKKVASRGDGYYSSLDGPDLS